MDRHHVNIAPQGQASVNHAPAEPMREITENELDEYREQDRFLPIANVARIMKRCLPVNAKISKDAKECVQECVSEFISFITSEAQEHCMTEKRKTINGEDILHAMGSLGFENYCPAVGIYLAKYRELLKAQPPNKSKSSASRRDPLPRSHEEDLDVPLTGQMVESDDGASVDGVTDAESDGEP